MRWSAHGRLRCALFVAASCALACGRIASEASLGNAPTAAADAGASRGDADSSVALQPDAGVKRSGPCGPPGTLDPFFGDSGLTTLAAEPGDACVAVDSMGRIYVAGSTTHRFTSDGQPDAAWAPKPNVPSGPCAVDAAGRFLVATPCDASSCWALRRFDDDGNADPSFGTAGEVTFAFDSTAGSYGGARVAIPPSGEIVVGGTLTRMIPDATFNTPALVRISTSGKVLATVVGHDGQGIVHGLAIDPLRGILLAMSRPGTGAVGPYVAEYGFDLQPRVDFVPARPRDELADIQRLEDGTLVVIDANGKSFSRLDATGAASTTSPPHQPLGTFAGSGATGATSLLALGDGSFVFAGTVNRRVALVHVHADDSIDATFGDAPNPAVVGGLVLTLGDTGPLGVDLRGAALDARGVVIVAALNDEKTLAVARVCR